MTRLSHSIHSTTARRQTSGVPASSCSRYSVGFYHSKIRTPSASTERFSRESTMSRDSSPRCGPSHSLPLSRSLYLSLSFPLVPSPSSSLDTWSHRFPSLYLLVALPLQVCSKLYEQNPSGGPHEAILHPSDQGRAVVQTERSSRAKSKLASLLL